MKEKEFYDEIGNWNFSDINCFEENDEKWDMYEEIEKYSNEQVVEKKY